MSRRCQITGRKVGRGNNVSHSKRATKREYMPNLRVKRVYSEEQGKWITLKVSVAGLRTINKLGLDAAMRNARKAGYME